MKTPNFVIGHLSRLAICLGAAVALLAAANHPARSQTTITASGEPIELGVGQGTLINLPRNAATIFVSNPAIADIQVKTPRLIFLYGKTAGGTSLYAIDGAQQMILSRPVEVENDVSALQTALTTIYPTASLRASAVGSSVMLTGNVGSAVEADVVKRLANGYLTGTGQLIDRVVVDATDQINLRVRIAEVDHTVVKDLGLNWDTILHPGNFVFGIANGSQVLLGGASGAIPGAASAITGIAVRNSVNSNTTDSIIAGFNKGGTLIDSVIDALDQNGLINTLAEPNLTATSGETASFLAGGEFPILVPSSTTGSASIEFKSYGVSLSFTPVILADGRISLRVAPEVSQLTTQGEVEISGYIIPALTTRRAETTVELASGQTFAIGGLLQNDLTNTANNLPGLGNLPVLGPLFRSTQFQRGESELVILVTPYLVRPSSGPLAAPTDGYTPPTDTDLYLSGKDTHATISPAVPAPAGASGSSLIGPAGFILN